MHYSSARKVDAPEGDEPRHYAGLTEAATYNTSVRGRQLVAEATKPEATRPQTASQLAAKQGLAEFNRRQAEKTAAEARAFATGKKVDAYQRKIAEAIAEAKAADARTRIQEGR
jgi:hypothetical protein